MYSTLQAACGMRCNKIGPFILWDKRTSTNSQANSLKPQSLSTRSVLIEILLPFLGPPVHRWHNTPSCSPLRYKLCTIQQIFLFRLNPSVISAHVFVLGVGGYSIIKMIGSFCLRELLRPVWHGGSWWCWSFSFTNLYLHNSAEWKNGRLCFLSLTLPLIPVPGIYESRGWWEKRMAGWLEFLCLGFWH